jgi:hypothetical protein
LVRSQLPIRSARQFPILIEDCDLLGLQIRLAAVLGLVTFDAGEGKVWFKGEHNPWTGNMVGCQEAARRCIVLLAKSVRTESIYPTIVEFVLGDLGVPWCWEYGYD